MADEDEDRGGNGEDYQPCPQLQIVHGTREFVVTQRHGEAQMLDAAPSRVDQVAVQLAGAVLDEVEAVLGVAAHELVD